MIPFFRRIRKQLADDNKPLKYMRYAIGEIVLVVIGILIALQINNWNEDRKLKATRDAYIERLINDIIDDTTAIHNGLSIRRETMANIEAYYKFYNTTKTSLKTAIDSAMNVQTGLYRYIPINQTYEDMKSSGNLNLLSQQQQRLLSKLFKTQETELLVDEKLMSAFYEQAELTNNYLERRRFSWAYQRATILKDSILPFKSVYEMFDLKEDTRELAQGLIHRHNSLEALLIYHRVATDINLNIIEKSKEVIKTLKFK